MGVIKRDFHDPDAALCRCKEESVTSKLSFFKEKIHELDLAEPWPGAAPCE